MDPVRARKEAKDAVDYHIRNRKFITLRGPMAHELADYVKHFNYEIKDFGDIVLCRPRPKGGGFILPGDAQFK